MRVNVVKTQWLKLTLEFLTARVALFVIGLFKTEPGFNACSMRMPRLCQVQAAQLAAQFPSLWATWKATSVADPPGLGCLLTPHCHTDRQCQ